MEGRHLACHRTAYTCWSATRARFSDFRLEGASEPKNKAKNSGAPCPLSQRLFSPCDFG